MEMMKDKMQMEGIEEEEVLEAVSPSSQFLKSSVLSLTILGVLESEIPIDDSMTMSLLKDVFLPINPRFSSIMVSDKKGVKKWKKVEVNLQDHLNVPVFPDGMPVEYYDDCFADYLTSISMEPLPPTRPLWEIHVVKYPTRSAAGNVVFKLHHSLGDGYSLMGALLSCLQRLDNPLLPLTFPSRQSAAGADGRRGGFGLLRRVPRLLTGLLHTAYDFGWSLVKSSLVEDDRSPIRSGEDGVEFRPIVTATTTFSIDHMKDIKSKLKVTINDIITGVIIYGTRLYMHKMRQGSGEARSTALVLLNTRAIEGYKSVDEMVKPGADTLWGNRFAFLQVPLHKLSADDQLQDPLLYIKKSHQTIKRQKNSAAVFLTGQLLNVMSKLQGPEKAAKYIHGTIKNTSMAISNLIGPVEPMALANHPVKGLYFVVAGPPQSLSVTMISYAGRLRVAMNMEKGFMDPNKFKSCIEYAFEAISKAALESSKT